MGIIFLACSCPTGARRLVTHAVAGSQSSLPVASDLFFQSERLVPQIVLLLSQTADETGQLGVLPEQALRQGAGGASCQQGGALRTAKSCSTQRLGSGFFKSTNWKRFLSGLERLTSGTGGRPGDCCSMVMTSSTLDCTQARSSCSTSAWELQQEENEAA